MESTLEFMQGPLFRFCFAVMVLGLLRALFLSVYGTVIALRRAGDRVLPWKDLIAKSLQWYFPVQRLLNARPFYSITSIIWHIGLILVPLFYSAHVILWKGATGFAWGYLPQNVAHVLTAVTIVATLVLFLYRLAWHASRKLSGFSDFVWPPLLAVPFVTGFLMANVALAPGTYDWMMLVHLASANVILLLIPFSKIAHCVLFPMGTTVAAVAWKFPKAAGQRVLDTLDKKATEEVPL